MSKSVRYFFYLIVLIFLGLGSRAYHGPFEHFIHLYIGDVLYTTMFYFLFRWINFTPKKALLSSILLCFAIEFLQLYQAPWIQEVRSNTLGKLILGHGFLYSDLVCYTIGGLLGYVLEKMQIVR